MQAGVRTVIQRALKVAVDEGVISSAEYDDARHEVETSVATGPLPPSEVGGYALVQFLYDRAIEAGEKPPACAREWRELEVAMADCGPADNPRFTALQTRSLELARQCMATARRWSEHADFRAQWAAAT